jgi:membrane-bound metal-dependent hydrolase YbcI (DUF457 family)
MTVDYKKGVSASIVAALKQNLLPGIVLQLFAVTFLLVYFLVPESRPVFVWFGNQKEHYGFAYSFFATAFFGGLVPFLYLLKTKQISSNHNVIALLCFYIIFWGIKGMEVDFFYRLQGEWFGYGNDISTIVTKVAIDQFIYSALWAAPSITLAYLWVEHNYRIDQWRRALNKEFFCITIPTVIFSNWLVWIPAVSIVYAMPNELQIPLFNLVLCFWVLLLAVLNKKKVAS